MRNLFPQSSIGIIRRELKPMSPPKTPKGVAYLYLGLMVE
jgi:hypothetical protein